MTSFNQFTKEGHLKRLFDFVVSLLVLIVFSPVIIITALLIRLKIGSPILFKQERPGLNGEFFCVYKFRSMTDERDKEGELLSDGLRLTSFGKVIRKLSLDELPQLWNVLKGDMSFVGPRPLLIKYLPYYSEEEMLRHSVRPGITGWSQVNGRNTLNWDERLALDVMYVKNQNMLWDLKILLLTAKKVFIKENVVIDPRSIMKDLDEERRERNSD